MTDAFPDIAWRTCAQCGGQCCVGAHPPLSPERIGVLLGNRVGRDCIDEAGYRRLKTREDNFCIMFDRGMCRIHDSKPETCVAGPFTFDIQGDRIVIFLKTEKICPLVKVLYSDGEAFNQQFNLAVGNIRRLVRSLTNEEIKEICKIEEPDTVKVAEIGLEAGEDDDRD